MLRCLEQMLQLPGGLESHVTVAAQSDAAREVCANLNSRKQALVNMMLDAMQIFVAYLTPLSSPKHASTDGQQSMSVTSHLWLPLISCV